MFRDPDYLEAIDLPDLSQLLWQRRSRCQKNHV